METQPQSTSSEAAGPQLFESGSADGLLSRPDDVLVLSPAVTLTLAGNALLVSGSDKSARKSASKAHRVCGFGGPAHEQSPSSIDYYNILWAEVTEDLGHLRIDFAEQTGDHYLEAHNVAYAIDPPAPAESSGSISDAISSWVERLLDRSYGGAARRKRAWVLVNPHAGPGGADKVWHKQVKPIFDAARMPMTVVRTSYSGEAVTLAKDLNIDDYDIAIPCSGDGLPHEVFNGLAQRPDARRALSKIAVCHIPCGSGNAMSCNLYGTHRPTLAALAIVKGLPTPLDLISVTQGNKRTISFLSQALGMIADIDINTEHLRWMGASRFTYGFLVLAMQKKVYPCDIAIKVEIEHKDEVKGHYRQQITQASSGADEAAQKGGGVDGTRSAARQSQSSSPPPSDPDSDDGQGLPPLKYGTVMDKLPDGWQLVPYEKLGNFYCGNMAYMAPDMNFFSAALANDGLMDLVITNGDISLAKNIGLQLSIDSGHFFDSPLVMYRKVSAYRLIPRPQATKCCISIDGEALPYEPFQAEVHQGLGLTLSKKGVFDAPGPLNWDKVTNTDRLMA
ncbi:ATP-NAD kinase-like domain-containing protein [Apodospora peruviana]|uniref:ATP-NAD kinase-like domain-containing protein n=1 Tax=Apodospora peruviana TaxID=516989 RepID=A0AAE0I3Q6_9PEZI|nr:ATP-NAD kinase-like domain-containing protein [Apodospora peruviana]